MQRDTTNLCVETHSSCNRSNLQLDDNGGHDALKKALQSAIPKNIQAELPFRSRLPRGAPSIAFNVKAEEIETVQVLRDKVLSGELNLSMRQSLAQDPHASADIEVDQSEFLEAYERSLQRLSKLTDHQQEKLAELKEPNQDLHLTAPAGGGKHSLRQNMCWKGSRETLRVLFFMFALAFPSVYTFYDG